MKLVLEQTAHPAMGGQNVGNHVLENPHVPGNRTVQYRQYDCLELERL